MTLVILGTDDSGDFARKPTLDDIKSYLADKGLAVVPVEPTGNMVKAALHAIPPEWGVCTGRQMMDIYEAMATAAGEGDL